MNWLRRMMAGRYGFDQLGWALFAVYFVLSFLLPSSRVALLSLIPLAVLVLFWFRVLSRNLGKRSAENRIFMQKVQPLLDWGRLTVSRIQDRTHRYYRCPRCGLMLRVPRGRGRISISCPRCQTVIVRKT